MVSCLLILLVERVDKIKKIGKVIKLFGSRLIGNLKYNILKEVELL